MFFCVPLMKLKAQSNFNNIQAKGQQERMILLNAVTARKNINPYHMKEANIKPAQSRLLPENK